MNDLLVRGGQVLTPTERLDVDVVIRDGRVAELASPTAVPADLPVLDATGMLVVPGFLDLQCNGAAGVDLTAEPERLPEVAAALPRWGVTAWLPTIVTAPPDIRTRALEALTLQGRLSIPSPSKSSSKRPRTGRFEEDFDGAGAAASGEGSPAAVALGVHFEGPFLAPERRGAHAPAHLTAPDPALVEGWSRDVGVAIVTLAPELPGALDLVRRLTDQGVVVSLGHSSATAEQAAAAVDAGARWVTHLFNAMGPLHHRDPGLAGVALTDERLWVGAIVDGLHLHPLAVRLAAEALGGRLTLVTDAVAALGVGPGRVRLGDVEALADGEGVRLPDGTLAGSILSMDRAVANLVRFAGVDVETAVAAATLHPARLLGIDHERGVVRSGAVGDLVLLDPAHDLSVAATVIAGEVAYHPDEPGGSVTGMWRSSTTFRSQNDGVDGPGPWREVAGEEE